MTIALVFVAILLVIGVMMRRQIPLFRWLYIPGSVISGFVGLALVQAAMFAGADVSVWAQELCSLLSSWPGWLIAVVFAGMLMERSSVGAGESLQRAARQGLMVWIIVLGETAVGLLAVWLVIQQAYEVPNSFGMLIETGFAGGHGTAAAMGEVFSHPSIGLTSGKDLGMLMATFGLIYGVISGIFWINLGIRRGWISSMTGNGASGEPDSYGVIGEAKIASDTIDPLLLQAIWLALAFGFGLLVQNVVMTAAGWMDQAYLATEEMDTARQQLSKRLTVSNVVDFPLFIYTLFGGLIVRRVLEWLGAGQLIDGATINRLTSAAMDILVVAAITSLNLIAVANMAVPFLVLFVAGTIWAAICLLILSRWILPDNYWFQLGLINYGMSTGTTATGFVLLKMVDSELESGAAEDYALAAPLSAPFIGGGILTVALPLLVLERVSIALPAVAISMLVFALIAVGIIAKRRAGNPPRD